MIEKHNEEILNLENWNNKNSFEHTTQTEVLIMVWFFRYYYGWGDEIMGNVGNYYERGKGMSTIDDQCNTSHLQYFSAIKAVIHMERTFHNILLGNEISLSPFVCYKK